ncbi:MAG TPA: hypothetical protein O0Y10_04690 [Methanocorpusculum sp.]|nr:hypothetical protein [Methanocorpusculum sp.]
MVKKALLIIIVVLAVVVCAAGVFNALNTLDNGDTPAGGGQQTKKPTFDENAGAFQQQVVEAERGIAIPGWESISIPANQTEVIVDFRNPEANEGYYYMTFELRLADGESLYQSGLVRAGDHIQRITLSRGLPAGTYDAVIHVQPYSADDNLVPKNNADMKIKLIVT